MDIERTKACKVQSWGVTIEVVAQVLENMRGAGGKLGNPCPAIREDAARSLRLIFEVHGLRFVEFERIGGMSSLWWAGCREPVSCIVYRGECRELS